MNYAKDLPELWVACVQVADGKQPEEEVKPDLVV